MFFIGGIVDFMLSVCGKNEHIARIVGVSAILVRYLALATKHYHYLFSRRMIVPIKSSPSWQIAMSHHFKMTTLQMLRRGINLTRAAAPVGLFFSNFTVCTFYYLHTIKSNRLGIAMKSECALTEIIKIVWLGRRDSNPRMPGPKPGALPLGHAPLFVNWFPGSLPAVVTDRFYRKMAANSMPVPELIDDEAGLGRLNIHTN